MRSRLAPTPSGSLHLGNVANFLLTEMLVKQAGGTLRLRIDDCDGTRTRNAFVDQIFQTLRWLEMDWQEGPRDAADFRARYSQITNRALYFDRLQSLGDKVYACSCSRKEAGPRYEGHCRERGLLFRAGETALRLRVEDPALAAQFGDVVLWRKDDGPAYQWVSVVDDLDHDIDLIVRGQDLRASSELQKYIAGLVRPGGFAGVRFLHHPLIADAAGGKLSKSQGAEGVLELRGEGVTALQLRKELTPRLLAWAQLKD